MSLDRSTEHSFLVRPRHVAIVMDGNGRWAEHAGLSRWHGHHAGARVARHMVTHASQRQIDCLTLYAFSQENWFRPTEEVVHLMDLIDQSLAQYHQDILESNVRFRVIGDRSSLPPSIQARIDALTQESQQNQGLQLSVALSYGARQDMVSAVRRVLEAGIPPHAVDETTLRGALSTAALPDPDLIIRTGGEHRLSNFLLFEAAYAELCFLPVLWPDFTAEHFDQCLRDYARRDRRFGEI